MSIRSFFAPLIGVYALISADPASAQLAATQHVEKEVVTIKDDGERVVSRAPVETAAPGEEVIYALRFENKADDAAEAVVLIMPVPREIAYVEGSVAGKNARILFSANNGETYVARGRLTVIENGAERPAENRDITHIKWTLSEAIPAGATGEISFRGVVK